LPGVPASFPFLIPCRCQDCQIILVPEGWRDVRELAYLSLLVSGTVDPVSQLRLAPPSVFAGLSTLAFTATTAEGLAVSITPGLLESFFYLIGKRLSSRSDEDRSSEELIDPETGAVIGDTLGMVPAKTTMFQFDLQEKVRASPAR